MKRETLRAIGKRVPVVRAALRVAQVLSEEFGDDPVWLDSHSLMFRQNYALFDVLRVLNARRSPALGTKEAFESFFKEFERQTEELRGDFLTLCASINRAYPVATKQSPKTRKSTYPSGFSCADCGKVIVEGEPMWSVNVNREVCEKNVISVLCAEIIKVFCEGCATKRDFTMIDVPKSEFAEVIRQ